MAKDSSNKKLNEDLTRSYTHNRPKPETNPPQNRDTTKPQSNGDSNTQIRNKADFADAIISEKLMFEDLKETGVGLTDIDGVSEKNRHYLVIESKDSGKVLPPGQRWALERLREARSFTLFVLSPKKAPFGQLDILYPGGQRETVYEHEPILERITAWRRWANNEEEEA